MATDGSVPRKFNVLLKSLPLRLTAVKRYPSHTRRIARHLGGFHQMEFPFRVAEWSYRQRLITTPLSRPRT